MDRRTFLAAAAASSIPASAMAIPTASLEEKALDAFYTLVETMRELHPDAELRGFYTDRTVSVSFVPRDYWRKPGEESSALNTVMINGRKTEWS